VLIEANMINASPEQDQDIASFFERADGQGDRIPSIPSLQHARLKPRVAVPRERLRVLEAAGRQVFVPLIAFNAQYNWGGGRSGQTAAVYLVGRETKTDKLAPLRVDLGPRIIRGLGALPLPNAIRD
jgi:hypothetical protein